MKDQISPGLFDRLMAEWFSSTQASPSSVPSGAVRIIAFEKHEKVLPFSSNLESFVPMTLFFPITLILIPAVFN